MPANRASPLFGLAERTRIDAFRFDLGRHPAVSYRFEVSPYLIEEGNPLGHRELHPGILVGPYHTERAVVSGRWVARDPWIEPAE